MGLEVPIVCEQIIPGDRFRVGLTYQMQLAPMLNPVYDGLEVNFEAFFVPNRIIDKQWKSFWTGYDEYDQMSPTNVAPLVLKSVDLGFPIDSTGDIGQDYPKLFNPPIGIGSLLDFLGVQFTEYSSNNLPFPRNYSSVGDPVSYYLNINALPILAYNRIYDDWYRNERTQKARLKDYYTSIYGNARSFEARYFVGPDENWQLEDNNMIPLTMFKRNYKKDRFSTALPEPIIGGDVRIPVNDSLNADQVTSSAVESGVIKSTGFGYNLNALALGTIEQLKFAFKEYSYRMKDTYNGNRYVESIESHYGIRVPDSTLQRSLYLGSSRDYVNFGEVYQTSSGDGQGENGALGDYAGRGSSSGSHFLFDESFYEPGFFFVLMCVNPISRYFQGVKRMFTRYDRDDYFSPEYQNIGDDFITVDELYYTGDDLANGEVFGYNSRWIEYKSRYNELHGEFANPNSQMFSWNFARSFGSKPTISSEFSEIDPINKPFVSTDYRDDNYFVDIAIDMQALRPILATESF